MHQVGQGLRRPTSFFPRPKTPKITPISSQKSSQVPHTLIIGGERRMPHTLGQCCNPRFPVDVVAVMRSGGKCMIHASNCKSLKRVNPARLLPAYWSVHDVGVIVSLTILANDRPGLIAKITQSFYQAGVNIVEMHTNDITDSVCEIITRVEIPHDEGNYLERLKTRLQLSVPDIIEFR